MQKILSVLKNNKITPEMLTREMVDVFFYKIFVTTSQELIFTINASHNLTTEELIEKRDEVINYDSIYESEIRDMHSRFKTLIKYKVVLV